MSDALTPNGPPTPGYLDRTVPPGFDIAHHFRSLWNVVLPAVAVALTVAAATFLLASLRTPQYRAEVIASITPASTVSSNPDDATAPYLALAKDPKVLVDVLDNVKVDSKPESLAKDVAVGVGKSSLLIQVQVENESSQTALDLARQLVVSMDTAQRNVITQAANAAAAETVEYAATIANQLASLDPNSAQSRSLQAEYDAKVQQIEQIYASGTSRLTLLATANKPEIAPPKPLLLAAVIGIVALILAAELLAWSAGRFGTRCSVPWARRLAHRYRADLLVTEPLEPQVPPATELLMKRQLDAGQSVVMLSTDGPHADNILPPDFEPGISVATNGGFSPVIHRASVGSHWWDSASVDSIGLAVVVIDSSCRDRARIERSLEQLQQSDIPVQLVMLSNSRSHLRRHASAANPNEHR